VAVRARIAMLFLRWFVSNIFLNCFIFLKKKTLVASLAALLLAAKVI
jgi:hypothetical protein